MWQPTAWMLWGTIVIVIGTVIVAVANIEEIKSTDKATGDIKQATSNLIAQTTTLSQTIDAVNLKSDKIHQQTDALQKLSQQIDQKTQKLQDLSDALNGQMKDVEARTVALKAATEHLQNWTTGGDSKPFLGLGVQDDPSVPNQIIVSVNLEVIGKQPLRNLAVSIWRVIGWTQTAQNFGSSGQSLWDKEFPTLLGSQFDIHRAIRPFIIQTGNNKAVFEMNASALNGNWQEYIKVAKVNNNWEHWLVLIDLSKGNLKNATPDIEFASPGFPKPPTGSFFPITEEDMGNTKVVLKPINRP